MADSIFLLGAQETLVELRAQLYDSEDLLQELLAKHPNLIAGHQMNNADLRRRLLITRETAVPDGREATVVGRSIICSWIRMESQPSLR